LGATNCALGFEDQARTKLSELRKKNILHQSHEVRKCVYAEEADLVELRFETVYIMKSGSHPRRYDKTRQGRSTASLIGKKSILKDYLPEQLSLTPFTPVRFEQASL